MTLQWLPLQERQRQPQGAVVSEALRPRPERKGFAEAGGLGGIGFVEREKARWAEEDKLRKMERDAKVKEAQEMGMRIQDAYKKEQAQGRQMSAQALAGRGAAPTAAPALTKENMPEAAMETWKFISTLEPESQKFFIQQLKEKELGTGGYIETGGKRVEMPGSLGMYGHLVDKGLIDPATDTVIEKKPEEMKGRYDIVERGGKVYKYDTTTGEETLLGTTDKPEKTIAEINKDANTQALAISKAAPTEASFVEAKFDVLKDSYGMSDEEATELSKIQEIPKDPSKLSWYTKAINWVKNIGKAKVPSGYQRKGAGVPGAKVGAFNEVNVTSLVPVISDDVTEAERAHLKSQGATDSDIDEAIRRKAGE